MSDPNWVGPYSKSERGSDKYMPSEVDLEKYISGKEKWRDRGEMVKVDGKQALNNAVGWACHGIEDRNSLGCLRKPLRDEVVKLAGSIRRAGKYTYREDCKKALSEFLDFVRSGEIYRENVKGQMVWKFKKQ